MIRQPDDPGPDTDSNRNEPLRYGTTYAELTPMTLRVIRRNAGKVPPLELARALCWRMARLQKIAAEHRIDLHYKRDEPEPRGA